MKRTYELTVVLSPQLSSTDVKKLEKSLDTLISKAGGKVLKKEDWGTRELAYPIAKMREGVYRHWNLQMPSEAVERITKEFKLTQGLMRHLFVVSGN